MGFKLTLSNDLHVGTEMQGFFLVSILDLFWGYGILFSICVEHFRQGMSFLIQALFKHSFNQHKDALGL